MPCAAWLCRDALQASKQYGNSPVVTEILPAGVYWPAEEYHQQYLQKGGQSAKKRANERIRCYG
jgi:peptide-methionine (S)-S-oxide reductase